MEDLILQIRVVMDPSQIPGAPNDTDLVLPGKVFKGPGDDISNIPWTLTGDQQLAVVKTILMHKNAPGEAPAAAQFICGRLFREFGRFPQAQPGEKISSTGFGAEIMACAEHL